MSVIRNLMFLLIAAAAFVQSVSANGRSYGGSWTDTHARWLTGEWKGPKVLASADQAFTRFLQLKPARVRLVAQWDQVEVSKGVYDFRRLDAQIDQCVKAGTKVILEFGNKTHRWPETHLPDFRKNPNKKDILAHYDKVIGHYRTDKRIWAFQVENEPFNPGGPDNVTTPADILIAGIKKVSTTNKPVIVTFEAGSVVKPWNAWILTKLIDILKKHKGNKQTGYIGLDLYIKSHFFTNTDVHWKAWEGFVDQISAGGLEPMVAELQAEPWEVDPAKVDFKNPSGNKSFNPKLMKQTIEKVEKLGCSIILLWGAEHWVACEKQKNPAWIKVAQELFKRSTW